MKRILFVLFVLVLAACGGDDATDNADDTPPSTTPTTIAAPTTTVAAIEETTTTTEVEETTTTTEAAVMSDAQAETLAAYEATWNDGNEDAFRALFISPDVLLEDPENVTRTGDVDFIVGQGIGRRAMETELSLDGCAPSGDTVTCTAEFDGPVPIAINFVPWRDRYVFNFEDGQITHIKYTCVICINFDAEESFIAWAKDQTDWGTKFGVLLVDTEEEAASWLEWTSKWQEAGRP